MRPWVQSYYGYWEFRFPSSSFCCCCGIDQIRGCNDANFERSPNRWTKECCRKRDFGGLMAGDYCRRLRDRSRCTDIASSRCRAKWVGGYTDEVFFRDTVPGFLAWAVAAVIMGAALSSMASSVIGSAARGAGSLATAAVQGVGAAAAQSEGIDPMGYVVDTLFRSDRPDPNTTPEDVRAEATRTIASGLRNGDVPAADKTYLAQLVAARTGISHADAEKRVNDVIAKAKDVELKARQAADMARKVAATAAFFTAFAMLVGAFIAAVAATIAGHRRDEALALLR